MTDQVKQGMWFYLDGSQQIGPISEAALIQMIKTGRLPISVQVWCPGMTNWTPIALITHLRPSFGDGSRVYPNRPDLLTETMRPPTVARGAGACPVCGYDGPTIMKWDPWVVPTAVILALFTMGLGLVLLLTPKHPYCPQCGARSA